MNKFVPQVLRNFDFEWASDKDEWDIHGFWFAKQSGLLARMLPKAKPIREAEAV